MPSAASISPFGSTPSIGAPHYGSGAIPDLAARSNSVRLCLRCRAPMRAPTQHWREGLWYWIRWRLGRPHWHGEPVKCPSCGRLHVFSVEILPTGVSRPPQERCE